MTTKQVLKHYVTTRAYKGLDSRFNGEHVLCYIDEHGQITCYDRTEQHNIMSRFFYLHHTQAINDSLLLASYQADARSESPDCLFVKSKHLSKPRLVTVKMES